MLEALETLKRVVATFVSLMMMAVALLNGSTQTLYTQRLNALQLENTESSVVTDSYGGWLNAPDTLGGAAPGEYFRVEKRDGKWWFITPDGNPFLSKGVTDVNWAGAALEGDFQNVLVEKYGSEQAWSIAANNRLKEWGFNTVGPWSSNSMTALGPHSVIILDSAGHAPRYPDTVVTDFWSQSFEENTEFVAQQRATPYINDKNLIGYFLDNELVWDQGHFNASGKTLLQHYIEFPTDAPGRAEALRFVREAAGTIDQFNKTWRTNVKDWSELESLKTGKFALQSIEALEVADAFKIYAFRRYAEKSIAGLRTVDTNHLILGCRFHTYPGDDLISASADFFDVISMAYYEKMPPVEQLDSIMKSVDKPVFIEEWTFKSFDSGIRQVGVFGIYAPWVLTQKDRAFAYSNFVKSFMDRPYAVGYNWYKWMDNARKPGEIFSGDNCGLMNQLDEPYTDFTAYIREVNLRVENWHAQGSN